jgi:hypothetical protein
MFELKYKLIADNSVRPIRPYCEREIDGEIPYFQQEPGPLLARTWIWTQRDCLPARIATKLSA